MKPLKLLIPAVLSLVCVSSLAAAQNLEGDTQTQNSDQNTHAAERNFTGTARDAWITGKIETVMTLNTQLSPFRIHTDVKDGRVTLSGEVESAVNKDLAGELAKGIDGVENVENNIAVKPQEMAGDEHAVDVNRADDLQLEGNRFAQWVSDRTTTAVVKTRLLANENIEGLAINVDTDSDIVILTGTVESEEEKQLVEQIARNTRNVRDVHNQLELGGGV